MDLQFSTGLEEYNLNGRVKVHFNPTDSGFVEKLLGAFSALEGKESAYQSEVKNDRDLKAVFDTAHAYDAEMRAILDGTFDVPVCEALFGDMNVYAAADGLPVWCNLLLACLDVVYDHMGGLESNLQERVQAISAKYKRKYGA